MRKNLLVIVVCLLSALLIWAAISLGNKYQAVLSFPVKIVDIPKGHSAGSLSSPAITLTVYGKGWDILRYYLSSGHEFLVSAARDTGAVSLSVARSAQLNTWLTGSAEIREFQPALVQCYIQKTSYKYVRVRPMVTATFAEGYGLAAPVSVSPDSVLISGPPSSLAGIREVTTYVKEVNGLTEATTLQLPLRRQRDFETYPEKVTVVLDVQKIVETELLEIPIIIRDVPPDRQVVVIPEKMDVTIRGGLNVLAGIGNTSIVLYRYYSELLADSAGTLVPEVGLPPNASLVGTRPQSFKFIIKKF